ncbi:hypothetical protein CWE08_08495 [Aliidiomarina iranensis]|uniref:Uncharacterized protein n=1 Tax=Aliidiomarina iranensis TaxID=1434071 RepID=A0A432VTZ7_9GAMM|nr:hypothetical protein [Aliidiomarina iranensis]RUO19947.1 hypothetical protein CWE08_08495 [Aliidiomarina iranensis]
MKHKSHWLSYILAFLPAVFVAGVLGSVIQTQFNILSISSIGPSLAYQERLAATWHDLLNFAPFFMIVVAVAFIVALPVAHIVVRIQRRQFTAWCAAACAISLWVAFLAADHFAPMPTLIAATRTNMGTFFMILSGLAGGFVYAVLSRIFRRRLIKKIRAQQRAAESKAEKKPATATNHKTESTSE